MITYDYLVLPAGCDVVIVAGDLGMTGRCPCHNPTCESRPLTMRFMANELNEKGKNFLLIHCNKAEGPEEPQTTGAVLPPLYHDPTIDVSTRTVAVVVNVNAEYKQRIMKLLQSCHPVSALRQMKGWREQDKAAPLCMHHPDWMNMSAGIYAGPIHNEHESKCRCSLLAFLRRPIPCKLFSSLKVEGDINGVHIGACENCTPGLSLSEVVEVLNSQKKPVLVVVIANEKTPVVPIPAGFPNVSSKRVALIISATPTFAHRISKLLDKMSGPEALEKIKGWAGEEGAPHVMMRPGWMNNPWFAEANETTTEFTQ